ncbi:MAG: protein kinase [Gemmatimonadaceae bacterium]|nr:protein kinase [Gemmatimonadaceae bacterium]
MIGERIGHLRVIASIGVGGMGAVWHAVDELLDRHVALKVIRPELMSRPGLAERFRSEAIVLARLQHPCIAALYGLEKRGEEFVMVMEFVDGETLDSRLAQHGALPWPEATRITRAVLDALDHAHESGVIHRDIKPANVMITRAGRVKVMDFGIARLVGAQRQTRTGAAVGTPSYMSPEQLLGQEVDGRADVYAVGTLLYELSTGHLPFEVEGDYLRMIAQLQQIPPLPSTHNPSLPPGLDLIIARALQKEPGDRFATSGEFRDALEDLEREHGVLRPYGTPAAGSTAVPPGAAGPRTNSGSIPAVSAVPAPNFNANSSALLTPVDAAMSVTPVPFSIEPAASTPIDLAVPANLASTAERPDSGIASPSGYGGNQPSMGVASPTPEYSSTIAAPAAEPRPRSGMPRALIATVGIVAVAVAGVLLTRSVTESETAAGLAADSTLAAATPAAPVVMPAPAPEVPPVQPAAVSAPSIDSMADSAAIRKALADSLRLARKARADSLKALRDSVANASVFSLPGSGAPSNSDLDAARLAARRGAEECVTVLNAHDLGRIDALFGGNKKNVLRLAKDGRLGVNGPLNTQIDAEAVDRSSARFTALLQYNNGKGEAQTRTATLRSVVQLRSGAWANRCLVDSDGGAQF